jgi:uncharacterized membrane-anchored protein
VNAVSSLIAQGMLESFSAGVLIYGSITSIIMPFFSSDAYVYGKASFKITVVVAMWVGGLVTAIIGYWA